MRSGKGRQAVRMALAMGAAATLIAGAPGTAQAATQYDGDATALRIEGLRLQLFPNGLDGAPEQLAPLVDALEELQSHAPEQLQRESLALVMPDQVIGQAQFPGTDTQGAIPDNPLLTADVLEARSVKTDTGELLSEASVAGLSLGGGVLSADVIRTSCTGTGDRVGLDISQLRLRSNQDIVKTEVTLEPGAAVPIEGIGSITFNQQDTDGTTYAEGTNVVIDLDSDLSVEALLGLFDTTLPAARRALEQVLLQLGETKFGPQGEQPLKEVFNEDNLSQLPTGEFEDGVAEATQQIRDGSQQLPEEARDALNNIAHLAGTITVSNAACAQQTITASAPQPNQPQEAVPAEPVGNTPQPPLADTGSPAGMTALGVAGLGAVVAGGLVLARARRREVSTDR
jgi:LPXTG-motif cell wall-anchored protein